MASEPKRTDGTGLVERDPWLEPYSHQLRERHTYYQKALARIDAAGGLTGPISQGHHYFGFNRGTDNGKSGVWYREWAPAATFLSLIGDFNGWDRSANPMRRDQYGVWNLFLSDDAYAKSFTHESLLKVHVVGGGHGRDRIPAYIRRVIQPQGAVDFVGQFWNPPQPYAFKHRSPGRRGIEGALRVYEAHIGMGTEEQRVGTFNEFTRDVLPRVQFLGYNAIQLMAIMEHPYYGSFGYHVGNLFAISSRFGTPEDLKRLIDTAHEMGILVLLDVVHSHAVKNLNEGLNQFDGSDYQYFHAGTRGQHVAWDSLCYDYGKYEVQRLLLSNVRFYQDEFKFDGFRFDGVTSMLYLDHGLGKTFTSYDDYFSGNVDLDALVYLQLANQLLHAIDKDAISIAEDVSGMVGLARPVSEGGLGFDYRLAMGVPDYWIKLLKEKRDEDWNLSGLYHTLLNRRQGEKHIGYSESHDQALVGDKTLAFWLMDQDMYWHMNKGSHSLVVDRGVALHKMIRLITFSLAGEGYLNFMGNEFGHPEWVDFPRPGNNNSFQHARRMWSLADREDLRYRGLLLFDRAMQQLDARYHLLEDPFIEQLLVHEDSRQLAYRRGPLVFIFNFHATESYSGLRVPVPDPRDYKMILNTDAVEFDGQNRVAAGMVYPKSSVGMYGRSQSIQLYLPARTAQVLAPV